MQIDRFELYARLGISRIPFPQYVNFVRAVEEYEEFLYRLDARRTGLDEMYTLTHGYFVNGAPVSKAAFNTAIMQARDVWALRASAGQAPYATQDFPGAAFEFTEMTDGTTAAAGA